MSVSLSVRGVTVSYSAPGGGVLSALGPVTFHLEAGTFVCLVGQSGGGKSTLIRVMAGLQSPERGQVLLGDTPLTQPSSRIGLMFQDANLMPWRTVLDNIALPLELAGVPKARRHDLARALLPRLGLDEFALAYPGELSGGMAQRAALGRVLIQNPEVLLLDEPFGALDALTREQISEDLLRVWSQAHPTVLMVTHDIHEAVRLADRVLVMYRRPGYIVADIPVTLPRPRHLSDTYSAAFGQIAENVRTAIEQS